MSRKISHSNLKTVANPRSNSANQSEIPPPPPIYSTQKYLRQNSSVSPYDRPGNRHRNKKREWAWVVIAGSLISIFLVLGIGLTLFLSATRATAVVLPTADVVDLLPTPQIAHSKYGTGASGSTENLVLPDGNSIAIRPWDGRSRFTMVLAGLDRRKGETGLAYRTDTMMLVSIDPETRSIGILSIPRDMFVVVPGYAERQRINTPMVLGEFRNDITGAELMMQTVQLNLGIRVNDYMAVDFQAVIDLVNAIGGIHITTDYTINDRTYPDLNYGYDPFYLPAGEHLLNGYDALRFARTRHGDNDIRRAERQQQTILAIRDKILQADMIPQLIFQAPALWESFRDNFYTGLSLEQLIQLALYVKDIPLENIKLGVIDFNYLSPFTTSGGASVLIPNQGKLSELMVATFGNGYNQ